MDTLQTPRKTWWSRNWKWFVPTGCFSLVAIFIGFIFLLVLMASSLMKSSDAYRQALDHAKANPAVIEALGKPIEPGFFASGSVNVSGASGHAELSIPLSGPKGSGTVYAEATKTAGQWRYTRLEVEIVGRPSRIHLLGGVSDAN